MAARKKNRTSDRAGLHPNAVASAAAAEAGSSIVDDSMEGYYSDQSATLGDRIAAARQQAGLTQAGLAERLGVTARVVSSWENDRSEPRANRLAILSGLLGVSVAWLLAGRGDGVIPPGEPGATQPTQIEAVRLSLVVDDLAAACSFYGDQLGCPIGLAGEDFQEVDFFGVRIHLQRVSDLADRGLAKIWATDEDGVPVPHVGFDLAWEDWSALIERIRAAGGAFDVEPAVRGLGEPRERAVFVLRDPAGNALVFRAVRDMTSAD